MTNSPERHPDTPIAPNATKIGDVLPEQRRIAELESRIGRLEQELKAVYASRSWRITRPLRSVASATAGWIRHARAFLGVKEETRQTDHPDAARTHACVATQAEASPSGASAPPPSTNLSAQAGLAFCPPTEERHLGKEARKIHKKLKDALSTTCE